MPINEFRAISLFIRTAGLGSLRRAAQAQGLTPQAASKALAQLERHLGVRLFHRTTRSMALTEEGRRLLESTHPLMQGLEHALHAVRQTRDEIAGPLRISGPRTTLRPLIDALLAEFCARHPDIRPEVVLDDRVGNWVEERVDVGFRMGVSPHEGVIARRLFALQLIVCAAPAYLARHGAPHGPGELGMHRCSAYRHPGTQALVPWRLRHGDEVVDQHVAAAFSTNDEELELGAVLRGEVIAQLAGPTAAAHIRAGRLVPLLPAHVSDHYSVFLYYGSRAAQPARTRAFIDLVVARLAESADHVLTRAELEAAHARGLAGLAPPVA
ncbi:MAG: LysR family transcriptional regulator [Candidatus Dactylopiibacterium sp.]|nr:LysR family transcriptional regulator [Candidatus Dactylopiibacterium sp.]